MFISWVAEKTFCLEYTKKMCSRDRDIWNHHLKLGPEQFPLFWIPDVYIMNAKKDAARNDINDLRYLKVGRRKEVPTANRTCQMKYAAKSYASVSCTMDFANFPSDVQVCKIKLRSCKCTGLSSFTCTYRCGFLFARS